VERNASRLDGNGAFLLVFTGIHDTSITSGSHGYNTGSSDQGIGQGRLSVIDVGNDGHVTDVLGAIHNFSELINSEVHHVVLQKSAQKIN
jgi:hypothetical protein